MTELQIFQMDRMQQMLQMQQQMMQMAEMIDQLTGGQYQMAEGLAGDVNARLDMQQGSGAARMPVIGRGEDAHMRNARSRASEVATPE